MCDIVVLTFSQKTALTVPLAASSDKRDKKGCEMKKQQKQQDVEFLKVSEVAEKLKCSKRTVVRRIKEGTFSAVEEGGRYLIHAWSVSAHIANLQRVGGGR